MNYPQIKPTLNLDFSNTKTLDPRINFRRGTPGAYYDGKTHAKAEENLLSYSEKFDQAGTTFGLWDSRNLNLTNNSEDEFLAPDGTQTAWKISDSGTSNSNHSLFQRVYTTDSSQERITTSIFAKAGDVNRYLQLLHGADDTNYGFPFANFDLFTGTITRSEETLNASMTDVGNGWYRCSITFFTTTVSGKSINPVFYMVDNPLADRDEYYTGDGSSGFYIWGAQLEQRDGVTAYTPTNGNPITKYQPKLMFASPDQPRFDHDVLTGESKGLLIEESRTNLTRDSQYFTSTNWSRFNTNIFSNYVVAPDGTLTGSVLSAALTEDGYVGIETVANYISYTQGKSYTSSYYLKKGSHNYCQLYAQGLISTDFANFNLDTGEVSGGSNASIEHVGNGWYRCSLTVVANTSTVTAASFLVIVDSMSSTRAANKTYTNTDDNIYIWGAQLEEGSFPTSYIKTSGASATRSADNASITGENFSSWYRQDEGSLYIDSDKGNLGTSFAGYVSFHTEDFSNSEYYWLLHNSSNEFQFLVAPGVASLVDGIDTSLGSQKACVSWADDDFSMSVNGNTIQSDTDGPAKKNLAGLRIGFSPYSDSHYLNSHIKKISYYPQRLTNEQLQQLTK